MIPFSKEMKIKYDCIANNRCISLNIQLKNDKKNLSKRILIVSFFYFKNLKIMILKILS